ncbi:NUDIX domain-containing protein [Blastococcus xanthinilyticus]|uniref:ADP-ribose pyrophosphatase YjhB (NUDIX family) n=1 Tax=Blastococcus xanthinilyticus TaxID=1564164 RepID=A0A5S5CVH2_9ACTN|nr:NUDIX hydrolase [Blastococcus xanthinilyticus]TYP86552.1 ADP-ribose pyrophosphatase YjhB (NUDIX family) [Blastococcus xanthinilyticus]
MYRNPWLRLREDAVVRDDGSAGVYAVIEKPHFAVVLAAERDGFWLVEQFRHPVGRRTWEFPQGTWPDGGSGSAEELARAELAEETGLRAGTLEHLGHLDLAPGLSTQEFDVWLATDLTPGPTAREATEADMVTAFVPATELRTMIGDGRFSDGPSLAAYALHLLARPEPGRGRRPGGELTSPPGRAAHPGHSGAWRPATKG